MAIDPSISLKGQTPQFDLAGNVGAVAQIGNIESQKKDRELEAASKKLSMIGSLLDGAKDQKTYSMRREIALQQGLAAPDQIPEMYDPAVVDSWKSAVFNAKDRIELALRKQAIDIDAAGGPTAMLAQRLGDGDLKKGFNTLKLATQGMAGNGGGGVGPIPGYVDVNNEVKSNEKFSGKVGETTGEQLLKLREQAQSAAQSLQQNANARSILDKGVKTGFGANFLLGFSKALKQGGIISDSGDEIANTEAYIVSRAKQVGENIKNFGAGTGLSDADRDYAEKMAAGNITLDEKSIRKIMEMDDKASRNLIKRYNDEYQLVPTNASPYNLGVKEPDLSASTDRVPPPAEAPPASLPVKNLQDMSDDEILQELRR